MPLLTASLPARFIALLGFCAAWPIRRTGSGSWEGPEPPWEGSMLSLLVGSDSVIPC